MSVACKQEHHQAVHKEVCLQVVGRFRSETCGMLLEDWKNLYTAPTEENFNTLWMALKEVYCPYPSVVHYLESTWIPHKEKLMDAWVGKLLHLGSVTTSRAESINAFLKKFLSSSVGNLLTVAQQLNQAIEHQLSELCKSHADDKFKCPTFCRQPIFAEVVHKVSNFALSAVHDHYESATHATCTTSFSSTMGLPCAHLVKARILNKMPLLLEDFHENWLISRFPSDPTLEIHVSDISRAIPMLETFANEAPPHIQI